MSLHHVTLSLPSNFRKKIVAIHSPVIAFLPTDDIKIFESVPEMRQFLFDNIKGIISDAYKDFQQEKKSK